FQWTPYEDLAIRAVILDEFFPNPYIWHVKVPLVNYATVEMHQMDRVLDDEHKIDLQQTNTNWPIHSKPYLLSEEQRRWQIRVEREQRGLLNLKRMDDDTGPSTVPTQSQGPTPQ
ncbi:hypothetical protein Gogos_003285, partial [Gossypium gossypioides]|nr:hypothetical protein [Gossypium gossypioides]